jgi:hypothetical protein
MSGNFSHHHGIQNGSGAHPASYLMGTRGSFPGGKSSQGVKLTTPPSIAEVQDCMGAIPPFSNMPSWCGVQFKKITGTTLPLLFYIFIVSVGVITYFFLKLLGYYYVT